jgi:hypothetical protein
MNKMFDDATGLVWTVAGTALVLITLSGDTQRIGLMIGGAGLIINLVALAFKFADRELEDDE